MSYNNLDSIVSKPSKIRSVAGRIAGFFSGGVLALSLVGCPMNDVDNGVRPPPNRLVECPFNPAVEYALENNILVDYDVAGFGTYCFWDPVNDADKKPSEFLDPYVHNRTREMLDWMAILSDDEFFTHDQVQSLVTRFGEGVINPETGQKAVHDTGLINIDEYYAAREFYEKAKEMHVWATANRHRAESIRPEHYENFNAWSIRLFGWPFPEQEFDMPTVHSLLEVTGLEPSVGLGMYGPINWGLTDYGTPDYEMMNFIGLESELTGNEAWMVCKDNVEDNPSSSQVFNADLGFLSDVYGFDVRVQSMLYSPGLVVRRFVSTPGPPASWYDMTLRVEHPVSGTLMDLGGYVDGYRLSMVYAHISGKGGDMDDPSVPDVGDIILPRAMIAYLNGQRRDGIGDFQGYVPAEANIPGPHRPGFEHETQVDTLYEGLPPGLKAGWNDPRANRHDVPVNYSVAIGNRSVFSPCVRESTFEAPWIHEPK
ncbi:MAG: hypothetical protein ACMXYL_02065 [Candidatus Woesearchaeota archaeon]